jgi:hypothetical protein
VFVAFDQKAGTHGLRVFFIVFELLKLKTPARIAKFLNRRIGEEKEGESARNLLSI